MKYLWHIYMIDLDNRGKKTKFYGQERVFYTGITMRGVHKRMKEHVHGWGHGFTDRYFKDARKILVYVEYLFGTRSEAEKREREIKKYSRNRKKALIKSESNALIRYSFQKSAIVLSSIDRERQICLKM